jgi:hypothetical protein
MRWLVVAALCAGCKGKQPPAPRYEDARLAPADVALSDAAIDALADAPSMSTTITPDGVGPITVKHIDEDDYKELLVGLTVTSEHREGEDFSFDELIASKGTTKVLRAVINDRSLFKIEVLDPMFTTAAGVAVGMTVGDAAAKIAGLECVYEKYDAQSDAERIDRALRCQSESLPNLMFDIDYANFKGPLGKVSPKTISKRKIVQIVWLAAHD